MQRHQAIFKSVSIKTSTPLPKFSHALFRDAQVISESDVTFLTEQQREKFFKFLDDPKFATTPRHQRVATYLGLILDQFSFTDKTYTAQQSLTSKSGNCLSLTMLTTAYAQLAGVKVTYQLLDQNPIYSIDNNSLLVTSDHLRAVLHSPPHNEEAGIFSSVSMIRIDYFQTDGLSYIDNVSTELQLSLFYSNLAVEHLSKQDLDTAYAYADRALEIYKGNASALNTMGILHRKRGDLAKAEEVYWHGANYFDKGPTFVRNYVDLLESQSRDADLSGLIKNKPLTSDDHPWQWVRAGKNAYVSGAYEEAVSYYENALALAPDVHQVYSLAGAASFAAGDRQKSHDYIVKALSLAKESNDQRHYKRKLEAFNN